MAASSEFLGLDESWPELRSALVGAGLDPTVIVLDGGPVTYDSLDVVLVNYCWGFVAHLGAFLAWADQAAAGSLLVNPLPAVRWNSQKTYLADIVAAGVPVVPTTFVAPGRPGLHLLTTTLSSRPWAAVAGGRPGTPKAPRRLHNATWRRFMQRARPYCSSHIERAVDTAGETAMVFFGNQFSHAVHKAALLDADAGITDALWEREVITPIAPPGAHLEVARAAMGAVAGLVGETCSPSMSSTAMTARPSCSRWS